MYHVLLFNMCVFNIELFIIQYKGTLWMSMDKLDVQDTLHWGVIGISQGFCMQMCCKAEILNGVQALGSPFSKQI